MNFNVAHYFEWLENAISWTKESLKSATATRKRMTSFSISLTQLQQNDAEQAGASGAVESNLRKARQQLAQLNIEAGKLAAALCDAKEKQARLQKLAAVQKPEADQAALTAAVTAAQDRINAQEATIMCRGGSAEYLWGIVAKLQAELSAAQNEQSRLVKRRTELDAVKEPQGVDFAALKASQSELQAEIDALVALAARRPKSTEEVASLIAATKAQKQEQSNIYVTLKGQVAALTAEIAHFMAQPCCPTCLATGEAWKEKWKIGKDKELAELRERQDATVLAGKRLAADAVLHESGLQNMREADANLDALRQRLEVVNSTLSNNQAALESYRVAQVEIPKVSNEAYRCNGTIALTGTKLEAAKLAHTDAAQQDAALAQLREQHEVAERSLDAAKESAAGWNAAQNEIKSIGVVDIAAAQAAVAMQQDKIDDRMAEIASLEERGKVVSLARADLKRQMEAVTAAEQAESEVLVLKAVKELLESKQAALVTTAFTSLLEVANRFTSALIPFRIIYEDGSVGYKDSATGTFVHAETFNDSWQLVLYAGLCVSLAAAAAERVVIIDELSRLDARNKDALLKRMLLLCQEGVIHQFIGADLSDAAPIYAEISKNTSEMSIIRV